MYYHNSNRPFVEKGTLVIPAPPKKKEKKRSSKQA